MGYFDYWVNRNPTAKRFSSISEEVAAVSFLFDQRGRRKYLNAKERRAFLTAAGRLPPNERTFCQTLAYTGCRISEALSLTPSRIDLSARYIIIESLKKRRRGLFRAVPIPRALIIDLERVHRIRIAQRNVILSQQKLWPWCRTTAWSHVKGCMETAHIVGPQATPKGLRHAFAVMALQGGVPINFVKKWLGHARLSTTEIYADAVGDEEQAIAQRFWRTF